VRVTPAAGLSFGALSASVVTTKLRVQTAEAGRVPAHPRKRSPVIHFLSGLTAWASVTSLQAAETVVRVTDINPGGSGSYPSCLTVVDNQLFFRGNTELNDTELWRFDGTNATRVSDIVPGVNGSSPSYLAALNGRLYFDARTAAGATKMHRYDGTNVVALNLSPSGFWGGGAWKPVAWNSELWYWTLAPPAALASFNGATIARLNSPPWANSEPVLFNGLLYYAAQDAYGVELWRFNGSVQTRISDLNPDAGDGRPEALFVHDGALYFRATDGSSGNELWRYTGSGSPSRVADIFPGSGSANPAGLATYRGALYFAADDGIHGSELWRYDGADVALAADINPNPYLNPYGDETSHSSPSQLTVLNDRLYFIATDGARYGVWCYDGTNAVILGGGLANWTSELIVFQDTLYFDADDGIWGRELWKVEANPKLHLGIERPTDSIRVQVNEAETAPYVVEATSDFREWTPLVTNRPIDGRILFSDPSASNTAPRVYRAVKAE